MRFYRTVVESCDGIAPDQITERIALGPEGRIEFTCGQLTTVLEGDPDIVEAAQILICEIASRTGDMEAALFPCPRDNGWKLSSQVDVNVFFEFAGALSKDRWCREATSVLRKLLPDIDFIGFGDYVEERYEHPVYPHYDPGSGWMLGHLHIRADLAEVLSYLLDIPFCPPAYLDDDARDFLLVTEVAGMNYVDGIDELLEGLSPGDVLDLSRSPSNNYDSRAIRVRTGSGKKLGYIPAKYNLVVANLMDQGYRTFAAVQKVDALDRYLQIIVYRQNRGFEAVRHFSDASSSEFGHGFVMDVLPVTRASVGFVDFDADPIHFTYTKPFD